MQMTFTQKIITILMLVIGTLITRFLPFIVFRTSDKTPRIIKYLGNILPGAIFSMLVVYCFKDIDFMNKYHGIPEIIATLITVIIHILKKQTLLSIAVGTISYMFLVQMIFI